MKYAMPIAISIVCFQLVINWAENICGTDEFSCDDKCISNSLVCDSFHDCDDYSDESNCTASTVECASDEFKCDDERCISNSWVCDGYHDCVDHSDELDCDNTTSTSEPILSWSQWYGGDGGGLHTAQGVNNGSYVTKICIRHGSYIDAIDIEFSDGTTSGLLGGTGGMDGGCFSVQENECFSNVILGQVTLSYGVFVETLQFITSSGRTSPRWGDDGPNYNGPYYINGDGCLTKVEVRTGAWVDAIRFFFGNENIHNSSTETTTTTSTSTSTSTGTTENPSIECANDEFKCDNKCISNSSVCDGYHDCDDHSDEFNCYTMTSPPIQTENVSIKGWSQWYGGNGGLLHTPSLEGADNDSYVTKICTRDGAYIDAIDIEFSDGTTSGLLGGIGGMDGGCFSVRENECFSEVKLGHGDFVEALQFITSSGTASPNWGHDFSGNGPYHIRGNGCVTKMDVRTGNFVDAIRFFFGERVRIASGNSSTGTTDKPMVECASDEFKCANNKCIYSSWVCDSYDDCGDNSDEYNCTITATTTTTTSTGTTKNPTAEPTIKQTTECASDEFKCDNKCIYSSWVCDSVLDCDDHSDEMNCDCGPNQFQCANSVCIPANYACDLYDDCGDNSDEYNCTKATSTATSANASDSFHYDGSSRVPKLSCDGIAYNLFGFTVQEPAGVCNEKDGSMLRCGNDGNIKAVMYQNNDCSGDIVKETAGSYQDLLLSKGAINASVTCNSGNVCRYGIIKRYNSTDCDDGTVYTDISVNSEFNFANIIGECNGIPGAVMNKFVSCSDGTLTHDVYMQSATCDGNAVTQTISTGQCLEGNKIEILCGTAIDTTSDGTSAVTLIISVSGGGIGFCILICIILCCVRRRRIKNDLLGSLVEFSAPVIKIEGAVQSIVK